MHITSLLVFISVANGLNPNLFESSTLPRDGYVPNVGNGFIGYDVGCPNTDESSSAGYIFSSGVYSGNSTITPSRRALLPHQQAVFVHFATCGRAALESSSWSASIDIEQGVYMNSSTFYFSGCTCRVELSWIAHRTLHNISVLEISAFETDNNCVFYIESCNGNSSTDVRRVSSKVVDSAEAGIVHGVLYETILPELPQGGLLANVSITFNEILNNISAGHSFTSILMVSTTAWTNNCVPISIDDQISAFLALHSSLSWEKLLELHQEGWRALWQSGIEVAGNNTVASAVNASLYYILSSVDAKSPWSISPGGLPKNSYNGHVFWDCETWMLPALAPFYPNITKAFVEYRTMRISEAISRATARGYAGAMYPWESAYTGIDVTPVPNIEGDYEVHVTADIALAARLVWYWSRDDLWLQGSVWDMITSCSDYFVSRVKCLVSSEEACTQYTMFDVMPPDELPGVVNHSVYTNAAAAVLLQWVGGDMATFINSDNPAATAAAYVSVANKMYIPISSDLWTHKVHPEYEGYSGEPINQADVVLLQFPLSFDMPADLAYNDLRYYENLTSIPGVTKGFYTGDSSYSIAYLNLYRNEAFTPWDGANLKLMADAQLSQAFSHIDINNYYIWHETIAGGHINFVTGAGGFLQNIIYGYGGLRPDSSGLIIDQPILPNLGVTSITLRNIYYCGSSFSLSFDNSAMTIRVIAGKLFVYGFQPGSGDRNTELLAILASDEGCSSEISLDSSQAVRLTSEVLYDHEDDSVDKDKLDPYYAYLGAGGALIFGIAVYFLCECLRNKSDLAEGNEQANLVCISESESSDFKLK